MNEIIKCHCSNQKEIDAIFKCLTVYHYDYVEVHCGTFILEISYGSFIIVDENGHIEIRNDF